MTDVASIPQHIISSGSASLLGHLGLTHNQVMSPSSPTSSASSSSSSAEERRLQLVVFGPEGSGKSTLVHNLTGKKFEETDSSAQYLTVSGISFPGENLINLFLYLPVYAGWACVRYPHYCKYTNFRQLFNFGYIRHRPKTPKLKCR